MDMHELEGFDEVMRKLIAKLPAEQVLAIYEPQQRVAGLTPEQLLLTLPDEALRSLRDTYLDTLSEATRTAIRARIGR